MEPASLAAAYGALRPSMAKLAEYVVGRLTAELNNVEPVITHRLKALGPTYAKLQTGHFDSLLALEDLVGVKVVLLRRKDIRPAAEVIRTSFQLVREKDRITEPGDFRYREPHVVVKPPQDYLDRNPDVSRLAAEIQLTSVVQHALDQVTHGFDYKPTSLDWAKRRLVSQLRATLELVDDQLDNLEDSAALVETPPVYPAHLQDEQGVLQAFADIYSEDELPADRRRLAECGAALMRASGATPGDLSDLLRRHPDLTGARSITPLDALLGALLRENYDDVLAQYGQRFAISTELETICEEAAKVPEDRRVDLT